MSKVVQCHNIKWFVQLVACSKSSQNIEDSEGILKERRHI